MKTNIRKIFSAILMAMMVIAWYGCSDDNVLRNSVNSTLEVENGYKMSSFLLDKNVWEIPDAAKNIAVKLRSHTDNVESKFGVEVENEGEKYRLTIYIPQNIRILDGDYDVIAETLSGEKFGSRLTCTFKDEMMHNILATSVAFRLSGEGTEQNPYLIKTADDFEMFTYGLYQDSVSHGYGLYFKQSRDFEAPPVSDIYTGRNYAGYSFAGTYDGGGHEINLVYAGSKSSRDEKVGLFKVLYGGAKIKNLTISANLRGINQSGGALAGEANGTVNLNNVTVKGSITDSRNQIGGFIGRASGDLTVEQCRLLATVAGNTSVGGLLGYFENGKLVVNDFSNLKPCAIKGTIGLSASGSGLGGVLGELYNASCSFSKIVLSHPISEEDVDVPVIYSKGSEVGGLIGKAVTNGTSSFTDIKVQAPVRGEESSVGGLVGRLSAGAKLTLKKCECNSFVKGYENVGGFFGQVNMANGDVVLDSQNYVRPDYSEGYISIEATKYVGGVVGYMNSKIIVNSDFGINAPVVAYSTGAGGIVGSLKDVTLSVGKFKLDSNMRIYGPDAVGGLVGCASVATIEGDITEIKMDTSYPSSEQFASNFAGTVSSGTSGHSSSSGTSMGGIVGYSNCSTIRGVCFSGSVFGADRVGGIIGHMKSGEYFYKPTVTNCISRGKTVTNTSNTSTGGIIGKLDYTYGTYERLINYSRVEGAEYTGGVIGQINMCDVSGSPAFKLSRVINVGTVTGSKNVGGCVGYIGGSKAKDNKIEYCANYGAVSNNGSGHVGGILGYGTLSHSTISACANHGAIYGGSSGNSDVGGICGRFGQETSGVYVNSNTQLEKCCNRGTISSGHKNSYIGGILGRHAVGSDVEDKNSWQTCDCYNAGAVTTKHSSDTGGVIGYVDHYSDVHRCINIGKVSYGNGVVGTRKSACIWHHNELYYLEGTGKGWCADSFKSSDKQNKSKFKNFDFDRVWAIDSDNSKNNGYPYLRDCPYQ